MFCHCSLSEVKRNSLPRKSHATEDSGQLLRDNMAESRVPLENDFLLQGFHRSRAGIGIVYLSWSL